MTDDNLNASSKNRRWSVSPVARSGADFIFCECVYSLLTSRRTFSMVGMFFFATAMLSFGCGGSNKGTNSASDDPCQDVELAVEKVWSASVRAQIMEYGGGVQAETRKALANKMDVLAEDWVRLRRSVCRDHFVRGLIGADEYRKQVKCFDDRLDQQRRLVELMKSGEGAAAETFAESLEVSNACQ